MIQFAIQQYAEGELYKEILNLHSLEIEHSAAVASIAVIFAMGCEVFSAERSRRVGDGCTVARCWLRLASPRFTVSLVQTLSGDEKSKFENHVNLGLQLLQKMDFPISETIQKLILSHHERWDGLGYPNGLKEHQVTELAQLLSMADLLNDMMFGRLDGVTRSPEEAVSCFMKLQGGDSSCRYFNPILFESICKLLGSEVENHEPRHHERK